MMATSVAIPVNFRRRYETGLRRFAAVTYNPLKLLLRRLFAAVLRWFAVVTRNPIFCWCGGSAAVASVFPPYPPMRVRAREGRRAAHQKAPRKGRLSTRAVPMTDRSPSPAPLILGARLTDLARRLERLAPSHRDPERYHLEKDALLHDLRLIAATADATTPAPGRPLSGANGRRP
jgi:hypothetical protein